MEIISIQVNFFNSDAYHLQLLKKSLFRVDGML